MATFTFPAGLSLESFAELSPRTLQALFEDGFMEPTLKVVFGSGRFPVWYASDFDEATTDILLRDIFAHRTELYLDDCHAFNRWQIDTGRIPRAPLALRGKCVKAAPTDKHPECRHFHRHTCGGCGKVFLQGSLDDPACVQYPDPWFYKYIGDEVRAAIAATGGVSKTDPLVWYPAGPRRNGRLTRYDPDSEAS